MKNKVYFRIMDFGLYIQETEPAEIPAQDRMQQEQDRGKTAGLQTNR